MRRLVGLALIGILVGVSAQETVRPHGALSGGPQISQKIGPHPRHPHDQPMDIRDLREPIQRQATPTSANTVPAPVGVDSAYVPTAGPLSAIILLVLATLVATAVGLGPRKREATQ